MIPLTSENAALIPLVIGVTGHRDLRPEDMPVLEARVKEIFDRLTAEYPDTPLILLSPLAEGADRLVAQVALECGVELVVPLPLPRAEYEKDFEHKDNPGKTADSKKKFTDLLGKAKSWFELPLAGDNTLENIQPYGVPRDKQYQSVGVYILQHSQILIALWDGKTESEKIGGTAQVVRYRKEGGIPGEFVASHSTLNQTESGRLYHVLTPRQSHAPVSEGLCSAPNCIACGPSGADNESASHFEPSRQLFGNVRKRMQDFAADAAKATSTIQDKIAKSADYLLPEAKASTLPEHLQSLRQRYALADVLATHFQSRRINTMLLLFGLPVAMVGCYEIFGELGKTHPGSQIYWLGAYLGLAAAAISIFHCAKSFRHQEKHMDYRALAEGLRVQFFWALAGLKHEAADHYLRKHCGELEWIRKAIQIWNLPTSANPAPTSNALNWCLEHWVNDQAAWFKNKVKTKSRQCQRMERLARRCFFASMMGYIGLFILLYFIPSGHLHENGWLEGCITLGATSLLALSAVFHGYPEKLAWEQEARQYEQMAPLFDQAAKLLAQSTQTPDSDAVLFDLGKEALNENGDWVMLHRERPLEMPRG